MQVLESRVEPAGPGQVRVITTLRVTGDEEDGGARAGTDKGVGVNDGLGEGPTGDAIPDRIVRALISGGGGSMAAAEIKAVVGGNPATVNRQCWTMANYEPDTPLRLRGWVVTPERGRYALSAAAQRRIQHADAKARCLDEPGR